ncbi:hypothetical protein D8X80_15205 [Vibrio parahaemolyticus]|uniref:hypothetical protein n=1 Tax=Vibrio alginolyticus TaxID=663 RepID=UPI001BD56CE7|nr:hypothetical protein [Vibrio alginolyticus]EGQ9298898.1 hypothetical protein [Vibrio parahaemolyticus]EGR0686928.1 hypothetical protein [Vibrio parahaemolyticus]EGR1442686.1 hypothetical protein [Vibrio parahaemolyticus]MBT0091666.1 hypothetical protein [Vibrio alginolyticus]
MDKELSGVEKLRDGANYLRKVIGISTEFLSSIQKRMGSPKTLLDTFVRVYFSTFGCILIGVYFVMMILKPWFDGGGNWSYVQEVWSHWQTLNAAMIAFTASLLAVYAAKYHEEMNRKRQLLAARALLPQALSDLTKYTTDMASFYTESLEFWKGMPKSTGKKPVPPKLDMANTTAIFTKCMENAEIKVVLEMANILSRTQYLSARVENEYENNQPSRRSSWRGDIDHQLFELGKLQARVNRMFDYGRDLQSKLDLSEFKSKEVADGLSNLKISRTQYPNVHKKLENTDTTF